MKMIKIVKKLLKFEKTSKVKKLESDLSDPHVIYIHIDNEYSGLNFLNLYQIKCEGKNFFNDNFDEINEKIIDFIIFNIDLIKDYKEDLLQNGLIYEKYDNIFVNKSKCEDYLKINNRFIRWTNKYDKTYYKLIIYLLGVFTLPIIKMIISHL
jgi:hypothetical protein